MTRKKKQAIRIDEIVPSGIRVLFSRAQGIPGVISLGIGQPNIATPEGLVNELVEATKGGDNYYSPTPGTKNFREAVAEKNKKEYNIDYNPNGDIIATASGCEAIYCSLMAIVDPGDEVLIQDPCFLTYPRQIHLAGGVPKWVKSTEDLKLDIESMKEKITEKTKAIILNYPSNPTGQLMSKEELKPVVDLALDHDLIILSDEVYEKCIFTDEEHVCVPAMDGAFENTILLYSFSKTFCVPGWRIGYAAGPKELMSSVEKMHSFVVANAPSAQQNAIANFLRTTEAKEFSSRFRDTLRERMNRIVSGFNSIDGISCQKPKGSFYAFPKVADHPDYTSSADFCEKVFSEQKIALVPGTEFGSSGEGFMRASFGSTSLEQIDEVISRLKQL